LEKAAGESILPRKCQGQKLKRKFFFWPKLFENVSSRSQHHNIIGNNAMNTAALVEPASNPKVEQNTRAFLTGLNSGEGPPLEQLSPKEARDLLVGLQTSSSP
jgi:hypothetical protein